MSASLYLVFNISRYYSNFEAIVQNLIIQFEFKRINSNLINVTVNNQFVLIHLCMSICLLWPAPAQVETGSDSRAGTEFGLGVQIHIIYGKVLDHILKGNVSGHRGWLKLHKRRTYRRSFSVQIQQSFHSIWLTFHLLRPYREARAPVL